ncbi:MAG: helix-turn-helix domain-containing protein [Deltaproteobacteria bacterium]|nr:helix-turn-helix domain-containing protein [Deltaproteobacteria bacterium]
MPTATSPGVAAPLVLLTFAEAARMLRVSQMTIRRLVERGLLPCCRVARRVRFRMADIEAYVAEHMRGGSNDKPYGGAQDT